MLGSWLTALAWLAMQAAPQAPPVKPAEPVINTGAGLLENCTFDATASGQAEGDFHLGLCIGFIKGVTNTLAEQKLVEFCPPGELTNEGLRAVVVTWLRAHPELLESSAVGAVVAATTKAFPCEAKPPLNPGS